jgi:universal stress protein family protein
MLDLNRFVEPSFGHFRRVGRMRCTVVLGDVAEKIVDVAGDEDADLIVMSPRRRGSFARLILGSATDKVTRLSPCPVLSVCRDTPKTPRGKELPPLGAFLWESEA